MVLRSIISCLFIFNVILTQSQTCIQDDDCGSNAICSTTKECYKTFNETEYDNITTTKSLDDTPINTIPVTSIDMNDLLDLDISTGYYLDWDFENSQWFYYYISFFCPGPRGFWFHRIEIIADGVPNTLQIFIPGAKTPDNNFNQVEDNGLEYLTFDPSSTSYPFFAKNISIRMRASQKVNLYSINIYGAKDSPQPTTDPTLTPTGI